MTCKHDEFYGKLCDLIQSFEDSLSPADVSFLIIGEGAHILYRTMTLKTQEEAIKGLIKMAIDEARKHALSQNNLDE